MSSHSPCPARIARSVRTGRLAFVVLVALMVCAGSAGAAVTTRIAWAPCADAPPGTSLQCAQVRVPLDWSHPGGATIALPVIRHQASGPGSRLGTMFFNPGGPGDSGLDYVEQPGAAAYLDGAGGGRFDVVSWDPRGTDVSCFTSDTASTAFWRGVGVPTNRATTLSYLAKVRAFARRCHRMNGRLLDHLSSADTARDLDRLRQLVGDRRLTYDGQSYGSFIGEVYANLFPKRVRAMVLDSIMEPRSNAASVEAGTYNAASSSAAVFRKFVATCEDAGAAVCPLAAHGITARARVDALLDRLKHGTISAPTATPAGGLTRADARLVLFQALAQPAGWPELAGLLDQAASGDGSQLADAARQCNFACVLGHFAPTLAIRCADAPARHTTATWPSVIGRLRQISPLRGTLLGWYLWAPCSAWGGANADRYTGPWTAKTPHPVLVVGNRWDPNTSYANARAVAGLLGNAVLLTHDSYGHISTADPSACTERAITTYLVALRTPKRGTVCPSDRGPFDPKFQSEP